MQKRPQAKGTTVNCTNPGDLERDLLLKMVIQLLSYSFKVKSVLTAVHYRSMTPKQPSVQATLGFVKVETAIWCSKDPHAVIKASAQLNQSRQNKDTAKKV